ncbi:MAG: type IV-A pilus assembly ATPase PilB [Deltaproteobacteria bacterium]|nr:type IV-A pilus assembly ATPase PilB [Deltaproteobacteria bacterium]
MAEIGGRNQGPVDGELRAPRARAASTGLGELLLRENVISLAQLDDAKKEIQKHGGKLGGALAHLGYVSEAQLVSFLSKQYGVPSVNVDEVSIPEEVLKLIPNEVARRHGILPINKEGSSLIVAVSDPSNIYAMDDIKFLTGYSVEMVVAAESQIRQALDTYYSEEEAVELDEVFENLSDADVELLGAEEGIDIEQLERDSQEEAVVRLVNLILVDAIRRGASDIHIEPYEKELRIRYRIDGTLYEMMKPPIRLKNAITSRLKIMSELDISERRLPQDGRIKLVLGRSKEVDFRVSVLPMLFGEKVVLRILDKSSLQLDMTKLGFEDEQLRQFKSAIHQPWGMVLVTGPTGSGKTTTLYSALIELNRVEDNISTAEDPVEFNMPGLNQVQINEAVGLNFAAALRSFLRQDPDIIMVGEVRDFETAEIAVKAALTGHLVLSTLHTNDAPSTVNRLLNMGVEPFLVTSSVNLILAQRLARKLCKECKRPLEMNEEKWTELKVPPELREGAQMFEPVGCKICNETGYKGRIAVYEVMPFYDELREAVLQGFSAMELKREAMRLGMLTLRQAAVNKMVHGETSIAEVLRTSRQD